MHDFRVSDIIAFYGQFEENIKRTTIDWRIYELKNKGVLQRVGRGRYSLGKGTLYHPEINKPLKSLYAKIYKHFPYLKICLWNTKWINEFMIHQPGRFYQLIETDKDATESLFYFLKEHKKDVFLAPSIEILNQYAFDKKEITIITNLVTEAPVQTINKTPTVTLEKMLVDIFCDPVLFGAQQGAEMKNIYSNAFDIYIVDEPKLLRYAARRKRKEEIHEFIKPFTKKRH